MRKITNELIMSFKNYLIEEEKSENTIEKYIRDITFFMAWLCGQEVTKILALDYKKELCEKYAPASVNAAISSLNSFFAFMEWHDIRIKALKIQRQIFSGLSHRVYSHIFSRRPRRVRMYICNQRQRCKR